MVMRIRQTRSEAKKAVDKISALRKGARAKSKIKVHPATRIRLSADMTTSRSTGVSVPQQQLAMMTCERQRGFNIELRVHTQDEE